jgi:hypothetical protein
MPAVLEGRSSGAWCFDRITKIDGAAGRYRPMNGREAIKVMLQFSSPRLEFLPPRLRWEL